MNKNTLKVKTKTEILKETKHKKKQTEVLKNLEFYDQQ